MTPQDANDIGILIQYEYGDPGIVDPMAMLRAKARLARSALIVLEGSYEPIEIKDELAFQLDFAPESVEYMEECAGLTWNDHTQEYVEGEN